MVVVLLLVPLWLDPTTLRELRSMTPSPIPVANPTPGSTAVTLLPASDAPGFPALLVARDDFGRLSEHGWGVAALGGSYDADAHGFVNLFVATGYATAQVGVDGAGWTTLTATEAREPELLVSLAFAGSSQGTTSAGAVLRGTDDAHYGVRIVSSASSAALIIELVTDGPVNKDKLLAGPVPLPDVSVAAGQVVRLRTQAQGSDPTTIRAKAWLPQDPEPEAWQISVVDWTGRLQEAGGVGLAWDVEQALPNGVEIQFDDLAVWSTDPELAP